MKKIIVSLFITCILVSPIKVKAQVKTLQDIEFKQELYFVEQGKGFEPKDCIINPSDFKGKIYAYSKDSNIEDQGRHTLHFVMFNDNGNMSFKDVEVVVLSSKDKEEADKYINYEGNNAAASNDALKDIKGDGTQTSAYKLAKDFVGMTGTCLRVAKAFTEQYLGKYYDDFEHNYKEVSVYEAMPGDIIYYEDGGIGIEHWAVYLGGDLALQGNYIGGTIIGKVYLNNASNPQFRRLY